MINNERKLILTKIEASDRMRIYQEMLVHRKRLMMMYIPIFLIISIAEMTCLYFEILDPPTMDMMDVCLVGIICCISTYLAAMSIGVLWRPPTAEEMNELGDEII